MYINNMSKIVKKMNDLYVLYRKKFIKTNETIIKDYKRNYIVPKQGKENDKKFKVLIDNEVDEHLLQKQTIGVFAGTIFTKFICFDVDIKKNKEYTKLITYKLVHALQELGIDDDYIYISTSGNKGYHVEIFFDQPIQNKLIHQFYMMTLNYAELLNIEDDYGEIELRPQTGHAVKLPLGKHWGTGKICWYCDYEHNLNPIENLEYIFSIKKMKSTDFHDLMNRHNDYIDIDFKQAEECENIISKHTPLKIYDENINENITIDAIETLINNGLPIKGSRHNSLLKIAKYNKHFGMSIDDNKQFLIEWLEKQPKQLYSTKWEDCIKDIELIVKWTYENNRSFVMKNPNISININEMLEILKIEGKNDKVLLYSLLIHNKRYGSSNSSNNEFYMSYKQMMESTGLCKNTVINIIKRLESNNIISVIRSGYKSYNPRLKKVTTEVNRYQIHQLGAKNNNFENTDKFKVCDKNCSNCFAICLFQLVSKKELKKQLTRDQYAAFAKVVDISPCVNF